MHSTATIKSITVFGKSRGIYPPKPHRPYPMGLIELGVSEIGITRAAVAKQRETEKLFHR